MRFFFDECVGLRLARMLDAYDAENTIDHWRDDRRFVPGAKDIELCRMLREDVDRPVLITADLAMKKNPAEREALAESGLTVVFLRRGWNNLPFHTQAVKLLTIWPAVVRAASRVREPTAFEISPKAQKVQRLRPTAQL